MQSTAKYAVQSSIDGRIRTTRMGFPRRILLGMHSSLISASVESPSLLSVSTRRESPNRLTRPSEVSERSATWKQRRRSSKDIRCITNGEASDPLTIQAFSCVCMSLRVCWSDRGNDWFALVLSREIEGSRLFTLAVLRCNVLLLCFIFHSQTKMTRVMTCRELSREQKQKIQLSAAHCRERSVR